MDRVSPMMKIKYLMGSVDLLRKIVIFPFDLKNNLLSLEFCDRREVEWHGRTGLAEFGVAVGAFFNEGIYVSQRSIFSKRLLSNHCGNGVV